MVLFTFHVLGWEYHFWENLVQKNKNCQFKLEFGTYTNLNMKNSLLMFIFSVLTGSIFFGGNLFPKIDLVC